MAQGAEDIFTVSIRDEKGTHLAVVSAFSLLSDVVDDVEHVTTGAPSVDMLEQAKANARLIAAAPELLGALQYIVDSSVPMTRQQEQCWQAMLDAIAKATGEQR